MEEVSRTPTGRVSRATLDRAIAAVMAEQGGQVAYRQLLAVGVDRRMVERRVANGSLVPRCEPKQSRGGRSKRRTLRNISLAAQVFAAHSGRLDITSRRWRALLSAPEPAWLDHVTACAMYGVEDPGETPIHVVHLGHGWRAPRDVVAHRTTSISERDVTSIDGLACTTFARALSAAAADVDRARLDDMLDTAVRIGVYDASDMLRVLGDRPTLGVRLLTEAVGRLDATSGTFLSNFERRTTRLVETSTVIASPVVNVLVHGYRPDLWWRGTRAIVECDGRDYHRSPAQIAADEEREAILRARGFVFLRLRWHQLVYEEAATLKRIEQFVLANAEAPVPVY